MKNLPWLCLVFLLFASEQVKGQFLKGWVVEDSTNTPLIGVSISIDGTTKGTITNAKGQFQLEMSQFPAIVTFSYLGYESRKLTFTNPVDTFLQLILKPSVTTLPQALVLAKPKIDTVFDEPYSVVDYEFFDRFIFLLVYKNYREKYSLLLMNDEGKTVDEVSFKNNAPTKFYKGCTGAIHLLSVGNARQLFVIENKIYLYEPVDLSTFEDVVYPCQLATTDYLYFRNFYFRNQYLQYYRIAKNKPKDGKEHFWSIIDRRRIDMAQDERRFNDMVASIETRTSLGQQLSNEQFVNKVVYAPINAPIFHILDTVIIFNHRFRQIEFMINPVDTFKTVKITYPDDNKWEEVILQDEDTGLFYTLLNTKWGYDLAWVNHQTGRLTRLFELDRDFVRTLKIKGGHLYFLHNDFKAGDHIQKLQKVRLF